MSDRSDSASFAQRISGSVRGPQALRDEIADEIADHLACHAEHHAEPGHDPNPDAEHHAIRAFGDPHRIVRELRHVHLGGQIMFQKIMLAALVLVVAATATTSYFSWSAFRDVGHEMADVTNSTHEQLTGLNARLTTLAEMQEATQPPRLEIRCYTGPPRKPAVGYRVTVMAKEDVPSPKGKRSRTIFDEKYETDADGIVVTGPLQMGEYRVSGSLLHSPSCPGLLRAGNWNEVVQLPQFGKGETIHVNVGPRGSHELRLRLPPTVTWHEEVIGSVAVQFSGRFPSGVTWGGCQYEVDLSDPVTLVHLPEGRVRPVLRLPALGQPAGQRFQGDAFGYQPKLDCPEISIGGDGGSIELEIPERGESQHRGIVFDGKRNKPIPGIRVDLLDQAPSFRVGEALVTNARGFFGSLGIRSFRFVEMRPLSPQSSDAILRWPAKRLRRGAEPYYEIDVSKLGTVRLALTGLDRLTQRGLELLDAEPTVFWRWPPRPRRPRPGAPTNTTTRPAPDPAPVPGVTRLSPGQPLPWNRGHIPSDFHQVPIPKDWPERTELAFAMFAGQYRLGVSVLFRPTEQSPEDVPRDPPYVEEYYAVQVVAGEETELRIPLDELLIVPPAPTTGPGG